jgi:multiple sugar transport system substrate-binding protein
MPSYIPDMQISEFEKNIGFIPIFPVSRETNGTSSLMGGWELSIPKMSAHKGLAWELITLILDPKILAPWLEDSGFLPTQISIGQGYLLNKTLSSSPYIHLEDLDQVFQNIHRSLNILKKHWMQSIMVQRIRKKH